MTPQTVDLYMKQQRKPSVEFICNICSYFNVTSDWLLGLQTTNVDDKQMLSRSIHKRVADLKNSADGATSSIETLLASIKELQTALM
jgi:transcriptional regulator with XRE-family HTH domain